jgi:GT2 family glycosyltransferase
VRGKFLYAGTDKLYVRGVTYGTFRPNGDGVAYPDPATVERDFAQMAASGINSIRTYKVPPRWLLDAAERRGLFVMVGLAWEQHIAFLDEPGRAASIHERVRAGIRACAGHPAVLCYAIGNEIAAPVVRWHGRKRVERFLDRLCEIAREEDPGALVTYVNYPSTEYLDVRGADLVCFNVYLEERATLEAYLARLHNLSGDRPLVMGEIGLDSRRHGEESQAEVLQWQLDAIFRSGCAGAFVFAWTDEWYVTLLGEDGHGTGGFEVEDWDFGVTDRHRRPKAALAAVRQAFAELPAPDDLAMPSVSVVVCTHNGAATLHDCLEGIAALEYPDYEVIVVDDGSTDATAAVAAEYGARVLTTAHRGLAAARNTGLAAAHGEIVAYIDDDARPDPDWLTFLAMSFATTPHVAVGGPNVAHPADGAIASCVANSPGGPVHVLVSDTEAEHLPGCNSAFRKDALDAIGGFDRRFTAAGDDVDVCWRLHDAGLTLGFSPGAVVWHHSRSSVRAYWRQQVGYGRAEALLERKWPEKYNVGGHLAWAGRLYGAEALVSRLGRRSRIYHGTWGSSLFQSVYEPSRGLLSALPSMPEWYLLIALLATVSALGAFWQPLLVALPLFGAALGTAVARAVIAARSAASTAPAPRGRARLRFAGVIALLHLIQPPARLWGRVRHGLTPWRRRGNAGIALPWPRTRALWSEQGQPPERWLGTIEASLRSSGATVLRGGCYDAWDLEVRGGPLGSVRIRSLVEEHGRGRQFVRLHSRPRMRPFGLVVSATALALAAAAALAGSSAAWAVLVAVALATFLRGLEECAGATAEVLQAIDEPAARFMPRARELERATTIGS